MSMKNNFKTNSMSSSSTLFENERFSPKRLISLQQQRSPSFSQNIHSLPESHQRQYQELKIVSHDTLEQQQQQYEQQKQQHQPQQQQQQQQQQSQTDSHTVSSSPSPSVFLNLVDPSNANSPSPILSYAHGIEIFFSSSTKISLESLLNRIDYHLTRIMKVHRLENFKRSIQSFCLQDQVCESLIEIMTSTENLIERKKCLIRDAHEMYKQMCSSSYIHRDLLFLGQFVQDLHNKLEQLNWALNSNRGHLNYVVQVYNVPEMYARQRSQSSAIPLRQMIAQIIKAADVTSSIVHFVRHQLAMQFMHICLVMLSHPQEEDIVDRLSAQERSSVSSEVFHE